MANAPLKHSELLDDDGDPLSPKEAAPLLGVCADTVAKMAKRGTIAHYRIGRRIFISRSEIRRFKAAGGEPRE